VQVVLATMQSVAFYIGFNRAFASIRRKMMLNILMQVIHCAIIVQAPAVMTQHAGYGFF